jgi:hypothetical protein
MYGESGGKVRALSGGVWYKLHLICYIVTIIIIIIKYVSLFMQILLINLRDRCDIEDTFRKISMTPELIQRPNSWT